MMFPETNVNNRVLVPKLEVPAAKPSIPSVKLAPFETAVMIKITIGIKSTKRNLCNYRP